MKNIISLPYGIVDLAIQQQWTKHLAYFCHIRKLHKNGVIYNYTSRKLAEKLSKSHGTVNTHVQFLIEKGLLSLQHGHLFCANHAQLREIVVAYKSTDYRRETGSGLIKIKVHNKIKHTEWNINARVVLNSLNKQKHVSRITSEINAINQRIKNNCKISRKEYARYKKFQSSTQFEKGTGENVCYLSDLTVGKLLRGRSISNVREMFDFWIEQGLIKCDLVKGRTLDTHIDFRSFIAMQEFRVGFKSTYYYKGRIMECNKRSVNYGIAICLITG